MATLSDYRNFLQGFVQGDTFAQSDEATQQAMLRRVRDKFKPLVDAPSEIDAVTAEINTQYRQALGMGRYIPTGVDISGPWDEAGYDDLDEESKVAKIEEYRNRIPEIAAKDDLNYEDTSYYLNRVFDEKKREAQGENTGWVEDKAYRLFDGFAAGIASKLGQQDTADSIRAWSETNPKYDEDFGAQVVQGLGDIGASTAIFLGATAISGGNPTVGSAALVGTAGVERFTTTYKEAIEKGMSAEEANAAGIGSLPGAVVDTLGDRLLAGKFLPKNYESLLQAGSLAARKKAIADIFADNQLRKHVVKAARDFGAQGLSEAGGDWTAGYGAYLTTGDETFVPSVSELKDSFLVGGVIGAGMSGVESFRDRRAKSKIADELQEQVTNEEMAESPADSIKKGRFADAEAKVFSVARNWDAAPLPMDTSNTRFKDAPAKRFEPNRDKAALPFLPDLKPEEMLPKLDATPEEVEAFENLESPGKEYALEISAHEELSAFGRPKGVVNNYAEKIRKDFTAPAPISQVAPMPAVQETDAQRIAREDKELSSKGILPPDPTLTPEERQAYLESKGIKPLVAEYKGPAFRVYAIKRNGKMEVVPFATHNKALPTPFVFESDTKAEMEKAALASTNENLENLGEGLIVGVDVTLDESVAINIYD